MAKTLITLSSDFGVQTQGIGHMHAVIFKINPDAHVIDLMHGLPEFDITAAARTMETVKSIPPAIHVCVCDPGVGTDRKGIALETERGDVFVGPDNGVFMPAARLLGGVKKVHALENPDYMSHPVSPIFHGRDVFAPAAAYLSQDVRIEDFGAAQEPDQLVQASYQEAQIKDGAIEAEVIQINRFGSLHLNILHDDWDGFGVSLGQSVSVVINGKNICELPFKTTFGEVKKGQALILKDDYGRIAIAVNMGAFAKTHNVAIGDKVTIHHAN